LRCGQLDLRQSDDHARTLRRTVARLGDEPVGPGEGVWSG